MLRILGLLFCLTLPVSSQAQLVLNEILYDPKGSDAGLEFVELYAGGDTAISLDGVRLLFVNGAAPEQPSVVWMARPGLSLAPGEFYLVGGSEVAGRDDEATLNLQNGPDALWLARNESILDRVAWGEIEGLGEGEAAPDVSGASLGRIPDGRDRDDNRTDFSALSPPTPGRPNAVAESLNFLRLGGSPPVRAFPGEVALEFSAEVDGFAPQQEFSLRWSLDSTPLDQQLLQAAPRDTLVSRVEVWLGPGRHHIEVTWGSDSTTVASSGYQVGPGSVLLNEVMAKPLAGQPEWIELKRQPDAPSVLDGWAITDASEDWRGLDGLDFSAEGFALLASDPQALRSIFAISPQVPIILPIGGWPSLNNSASGASEFADRVLLRDDSGTVVDELRYTDDLVGEAGRSMERGIVSPDSPRAWFLSPGAPSPGEENSAAALITPKSGLALSPNPFSPDGDGKGDVLHVLLQAELTGLRVQAEIRDLLGATVAELGNDESGGNLRQWIWDGRSSRGQPVPMGAYVVLVQSEGGESAPRRWTALVALGRRP